MPDPVYSSLSEALEKGRSDKSLGRGNPPIKTYWLLRQHGSEMLRKIVNDGWRLRAVSRHFQVSFKTVDSAIEFIKDHEELVASAKWEEVEAILFKKWADYKNLPFYKSFVAPGYDGYVAALKKKEVRIGRPAGSKNRPKTPKELPESSPPKPVAPAPIPPSTSPASSEITSVEKSPGEGRGVSILPPQKPANLPVVGPAKPANSPYTKQEVL